MIGGGDFFGLALDPAKLAGERDRIVRTYLRAGTDTIADCTKWLERRLEDVTRDAVPGRLWRAWGSESYPSRGGPARNPSGVVYVNGGVRSQGAMRFFSMPGRIIGHDGGPVAIPLPAAGSRGRDRELTPEQWEARTGIKLRPVQRPGKPLILVADDAVLSGKRQTAKANTPRRLAAGRGSATVPIFVVLPAVDFANTVAVEPLVAEAGRRIPQTYLAKVGRIG